MKTLHLPRTIVAALVIILVVTLFVLFVSRERTTPMQETKASSVPLEPYIANPPTLTGFFVAIQCITEPCNDITFESDDGSSWKLDKVTDQIRFYAANGKHLEITVKSIETDRLTITTIYELSRP